MDKDKHLIVGRRFGKSSWAFYDVVKNGIMARTDITYKEKQKLLKKLMNQFLRYLEIKTLEGESK